MEESTCRMERDVLIILKDGYSWRKGKEEMGVVKKDEIRSCTFGRHVRFGRQRAYSDGAWSIVKNEATEHVSEITTRDDSRADKRAGGVGGTGWW